MLSQEAVLVVIGSGSLSSFQTLLSPLAHKSFLPVSQINQTSLTTILISPFLSLSLSPSIKLLLSLSIPN